MDKYHDLFFKAILKNVAELKDKYHKDKDTMKKLKEVERDTEILMGFEEEDDMQYTSSLED